MSRARREKTLGALASYTHLLGTSFLCSTAQTWIWPQLPFWKLLGLFNLEREPNREMMALGGNLSHTFSQGWHAGLGWGLLGPAWGLVSRPYCSMMERPQF